MDERKGWRVMVREERDLHRRIQDFWLGGAHEY